MFRVTDGMSRPLAMGCCTQLGSGTPVEPNLNLLRFVGRSRAMAQLHALGAADASNTVALVTGAAGAGKTTLLRHYRTSAVAKGSLVGWGVAGEWEAEPGLWPWYEALSDIDPAQDVISAGQPESANPLDTAEMFRRTAMWLLAKAVDNDLVIVIEDLHHAHPTTIALFSYLARRPAMPGVTLVASTRPGHDEVDAVRAHRVPLDGLSGHEIAELATAQGIALDQAAADDLARRTDGNPLFVQRLLESGVTGDNLTVPSDIAALLRTQLGTVPENAMPAVRALAVLGTASPDVLQRMTTGEPVTSVLASVSTDIVRLDDSLVTFRHGLVRDVVYSDLSAEDRFILHAVAADVLGQTGASPVLVAHHLSRAALSHRGPDAAEAARLAAHAERQSGAIGEAAHFFGLASSILRDVGEPEPLVQALVEESEALAQLGRGSDAEQRLVDAAAICDEPTGDGVSPVTRRAVVRAYARLRWLEEPNPSTLDAGFLVSVAQRWLASSDDPADQAVFQTAVATAGDIQGGTLSDVDAADAAIAAAVDAASPSLIGEARLARRRALSVHPGRFTERRDDADAALEIARGLHDHEFLVRAQRMALTDALAAADRPRVMSLLADEPMSAAGRVQHALGSATLSALEGRYEQADFVLDDTSKELSYLGFNAPALDFFRIVYAWDQGTLGKALAQYVPLLPSIADPALRAAVSLAKVADGEPGVAAALIDEALDTLMSGEPTTLWAVSMAMLSESAATIDHPRCEELYGMLEGFSGQCVIAATSAAAWIGAFDRYQGLLAIRLGRLDDAVAHLDQSLVIHRRMQAVPWQARSHAALALAHSLRGSDEVAADEHASRAHHLAVETGMDPQVLLVGAETHWGRGLGATNRSSTLESNETTAPAPEIARFERRGDNWAIGFGEREHLIRHSNGLQYLALLLASPGTEWSAHDLYAHVAGVPVVSQPGTGPALDRQAIAAYRERRDDLIESIDEATEHADIARAETLRVELDFLESELVSAVGFNGRDRTTGDNAERARVNVRRSIARAINQIQLADPVLGDHLERSVRTGRTCAYEPGPSSPMTWRM